MSTKSHDNGVVYIVTTDRSEVYLKAAINSARSVSQFCPGLGVHLFTDSFGMEMVGQLKDSPFSSCGEIKNPHYRSKVDYLAETPFKRTLYLDSDTRVVRDISEMFTLLDRFDLALAHAHKRNYQKTLAEWNEVIPESFPQYNGGVILFKNTPGVVSFMREWGTNFHEAGFRKDQVTLREMLWKTELRLATLPPEYNVRWKKYLRIWDSDEAVPKILHMAEFHGRKKKILSALKDEASAFLRRFRSV
jgi:hypothetical protein